MSNKIVQIIWITCLSFVIILIHDISLYPGYSWNETLFVAFLRLLIPLLTLCLTSFFQPGISKRKWVMVLYSVLWIFIIPYSFYNITQLRHISELCRLAQEQSFAYQCYGSLWRILPPFVYSVGSLAIFFYSVNHLSRLLRNPLKKLFLFGVFAYASFATVVGIYSRLDTFTLFLDFRTTLSVLSLIIQKTDFWLNVFAYFAFANLFFFGGKMLIDGVMSKKR